MFELVFLRWSNGLSFDRGQKLSWLGIRIVLNVNIFTITEMLTYHKLLVIHLRCISIAGSEAEFKD